MEHVITVQLELHEEHAWALAQLLKRIGYSDCKALAEDEAQLWLMLQAVEQVRCALAVAGVAPR